MPKTMRSNQCNCIFKKHAKMKGHSRCIQSRHKAIAFTGRRLNAFLGNNTLFKDRTKYKVCHTIAEKVRSFKLPRLEITDSIIRSREDRLTHRQESEDVGTNEDSVDESYSPSKNRKGHLTKYPNSVLLASSKYRKRFAIIK